VGISNTITINVRFPIRSLSRGYNKFIKKDVKELKNNEEFMKNYKRTFELFSLSYGWDLSNKKFIDNPDSTQKYNNYDIRLRKLGQSLILFEEDTLFDSFNVMVSSLSEKGVQFNKKTEERYGETSEWPFN
jgi:hypothetical protein